jgi:hypothetical protein
VDCCLVHSADDSHRDNRQEDSENADSGEDPADDYCSEGEAAAFLPSLLNLAECDVADNRSDQGKNESQNESHNRQCVCPASCIHT